MRKVVLIEILSGLLVVVLLGCLGYWLAKRPSVSKSLAASAQSETTKSEVRQTQVGLDSDKDGLPDWEEVLWRTDPSNRDTDGDGLLDGQETKTGHDPLQAGPNDLLPSHQTLFSSPPTYTSPLDNLSLSQITKGLVTPTKVVIPTKPTTTQAPAPITFPVLDKSNFNITSTGVATDAEFYNAYVKLSTEITFSQEELGSMNKDTSPEGKNRIFTIEELMEQYRGKEIPESARLSFAAWASLDKRMVSALETLPVSKGAFDANQELASWFSYHASVAEGFASPTRTLEEKKVLEDEYTLYAKSHIVMFGKKIAEADKVSPDAFTLVNKAEAFTCPSFSVPDLYNFGGHVAFYLVCNWGIVETITIPCGGIFLVTYIGMGANPFLYQYGPWVPVTAILGRSAVVPGVCVLGVPPAATYFPYEAIVIYYGASSLPSPI